MPRDVSPVNRRAPLVMLLFALAAFVPVASPASAAELHYEDQTKIGVSSHIKIDIYQDMGDIDLHVWVICEPTDDCLGNNAQLTIEMSNQSALQDTVGPNGFSGHTSHTFHISDTETLSFNVSWSNDSSPNDQETVILLFTPSPWLSFHQARDMDGDGIANNLDDDIDGDGIENSVDTDDDNDGILDWEDLDPESASVDPIVDVRLTGSDSISKFEIDWDIHDSFTGHLLDGGTKDDNFSVDFSTFGKGAYHLCARAYNMSSLLQRDHISEMCSDVLINAPIIHVESWMDSEGLAFRIQTRGFGSFGKLGWNYTIDDPSGSTVASGSYGHVSGAEIRDYSHGGIHSDDNRYPATESGDHTISIMVGQLNLNSTDNGTLIESTTHTAKVHPWFKLDNTDRIVTDGIFNATITAMALGGNNEDIRYDYTMRKITQNGKNVDYSDVTRKDADLSSSSTLISENVDYDAGEICFNIYPKEQSNGPDNWHFGDCRRFAKDNEQIFANTHLNENGLHFHAYTVGSESDHDSNTNYSIRWSLTKNGNSLGEGIRGGWNGATHCGEFGDQYCVDITSETWWSVHGATSGSYELVIELEEFTPDSNYTIDMESIQLTMDPELHCQGCHRYSGNDNLRPLMYAPGIDENASGWEIRWRFYDVSGDWDENNPLYEGTVQKPRHQLILDVGNGSYRLCAALYNDLGEKVDPKDWDEHCWHFHKGPPVIKYDHWMEDEDRFRLNIHVHEIEHWNRDYSLMWSLDFDGDGIADENGTISWPSGECCHEEMFFELDDSAVSATFTGTLFDSNGNEIASLIDTIYFPARLYVEDSSPWPSNEPVSPIIGYRGGDENGMYRIEYRLEPRTNQDCEWSVCNGQFDARSKKVEFGLLDDGKYELSLSLYLNENGAYHHKGHKSFEMYVGEPTPEVWFDDGMGGKGTAYMMVEFPYALVLEDDWENVKIQWSLDDSSSGEWNSTDAKGDENYTMTKEECEMSGGEYHENEDGYQPHCHLPEHHEEKEIPDGCALGPDVRDVSNNRYTITFDCKFSGLDPGVHTISSTLDVNGTMQQISRDFDIRGWFDINDQSPYPYGQDVYIPVSVTANSSSTHLVEWRVYELNMKTINDLLSEEWRWNPDQEGWYNLNRMGSGGNDAPITDSESSYIVYGNSSQDQFNVMLNLPSGLYAACLLLDIAKQGEDLAGTGHFNPAWSCKLLRFGNELVHVTAHAERDYVHAQLLAAWLPDQSEWNITWSITDPAGTTSTTTHHSTEYVRGPYNILDLGHDWHELERGLHTISVEIDNGAEMIKSSETVFVTALSGYISHVSGMCDDDPGISEWGHLQCHTEASTKLSIWLDDLDSNSSITYAVKWELYSDAGGCGDPGDLLDQGTSIVGDAPVTTNTAPSDTTSISEVDLGKLSRGQYGICLTVIDHEGYAVGGERFEHISIDYHGPEVDLLFTQHWFASGDDVSVFIDYERPKEGWPLTGPTTVNISLIDHTGASVSSQEMDFTSSSLWGNIIDFSGISDGVYTFDVKVKQDGRDLTDSGAYRLNNAEWAGKTHVGGASDWTVTAATNCGANPCKAYTNFGIDFSVTPSVGAALGKTTHVMWGLIPMDERMVGEDDDEVEGGGEWTSSSDGWSDSLGGIRISGGEWLIFIIMYELSSPGEISAKGWKIQPFHVEDDPEGDPDGDGILNKDDSCPLVNGTTQYDGCLGDDFDNDGVLDYRDRCVRQSGPAANDGCPDENDPDGDGLIGEEDKCPIDYAETTNGCPDGTPIGEELPNTSENSAPICDVLMSRDDGDTAVSANKLVKATSGHSEHTTSVQAGSVTIEAVCVDPDGDNVAITLNLPATGQSMSFEDSSSKAKMLVVLPVGSPDILLQITWADGTFAGSVNLTVQVTDPPVGADVESAESTGGFVPGFPVGLAALALLGAAFGARRKQE